MYFAFVVDRATDYCFLLFYKLVTLNKKSTNLVVDFQFVGSLF